MLNYSGKNNRSWQTIIFNDIVDAIKTVSIEEKQELQMLLEQYLDEERCVPVYQGEGKPTIPGNVTPDTPLSKLNLN